MALPSEMSITDQGPLSEESTGTPFGEVIRDYEAMPGVKWRSGKPNYARVNKLYFARRAKVHPEGSLEALVSRLVKNWEVESTHIADPKQWKTTDITKFWASVNGGEKCNAQLMADIGPYNMLIGETAEYSAKAQTFDSSNHNFSAAFANGFAFEVLEVLSGPPTVTFKWRHFGLFSGTFTDRRGVKHVGNGEMIDLVGLCIAQVSDQLQIESLDVYYNAEDMLKPLVTKTTRREGEVPVHADDDGDAKKITGSPLCTADGKGAGTSCAVM